MLRRINQALPELLLGILIFGLVVQVTGVWFVEDRARYISGLWIGIVLAMGMAVNMAVVILDTVEAMAEQRSSRKASLYGALRYFLVVLAFVIVGYFNLGNVVVMFVGVMGLKVSAYLQPLTHKLITTIQDRRFHDKLPS
ncbi:MAG: hypothetical protein HFH41_11625 [Lachnospiraceae bacterium]|nr:hypothetical protein [Lachnospiraceae bacterium]